MHPNLEITADVIPEDEDAWPIYLRAGAITVHMDRATRQGRNRNPSKYLQQTSEISGHFREADNMQLQLVDLTDFEQLGALMHGVEVLATRARMLCDSGAHDDAIDELALAFRAAAKLSLARGPIVSFVAASGCEFKCMNMGLRISGRCRARRQIFDFLPASGLKDDVLNALRSEYKYCEEKLAAHSEDAFEQTAEIIGPRVRFLPTDLVKWPVDSPNFVDWAKTRRVAEEMFLSELEWHQGRLSVEPSYSHLWHGLPRRPRLSQAKKVEEFSAVMANLENPGGKVVFKDIESGFRSFRWLIGVRIKKRRRTSTCLTLLSRLGM